MIGNLVYLIDSSANDETIALKQKNSQL